MLTPRRQPHSNDDRFWMVLCHDVPVGAVVQPAGSMAWHWSITVQVNTQITRAGKADTREEATTAVRQAWTKVEAELGTRGWARHAQHMAELQERAKHW